MNPSRLAIAALLALVGFIWLGQGVGLIGGSFMSGSPTWAVIGTVLVLVAGGIVVREARRQR